MKSIVHACFAATLIFTLPAMAANEHGAHSESHASPAAETPWVDGVVKKLDRAAGKVTLSHGPLVNLNMPAMTMTFRVKDAAWLTQMTEGARIRFAAQSVNGSLTVVRFEPLK